jgi:hypothetical protein
MQIRKQERKVRYSPDLAGYVSNNERQKEVKADLSAQAR